MQHGVRPRHEMIAMNGATIHACPRVSAGSQPVGQQHQDITGLRTWGALVRASPGAFADRAAGLATGRSFVTETRQDPDLRRSGADVQSITDALIAHAATTGGQLTSTEVGLRLEEARVSQSDAKKVLRALTEASVLVFDTAASQPKVVAARSATAPSRAATARVADAAEGDGDAEATEAPAEKPTRRRSTAKLAAVEPVAEEGADADASATDPTAAPAKPRKATARKSAKAAAPSEDGAEGADAAEPKPARAKAAKAAPATDADGMPVPVDEAELEDVEIEDLALDLEEVEEIAVEEPAALVEAAQADAETDSTDFEWDDEESEALKQARRDAELTASADSVRAYLKQIQGAPAQRRTGGRPRQADRGRPVRVRAAAPVRRGR